MEQKSRGGGKTTQFIEEARKRYNNEIYTKLAELCKERSVSLQELCEDYLSQKEANEIYDHLLKTCKCGNTFKNEADERDGFCGDCR